MNDEKLRQIREWQWEEGVSCVALTIFRGSWPYNKFLSTNPTPEEKNTLMTGSGLISLSRSTKGR